MTKASQIKRFLASTINKVNNNELEEDKGRVIGYLCQILLKAIEVEDLEKKIKDIENELHKK